MEQEEEVRDLQLHGVCGPAKLQINRLTAFLIPNFSKVYPLRGETTTNPTKYKMKVKVMSDDPTFNHVAAKSVAALKVSQTKLVEMLRRQMTRRPIQRRLYIT